MENAKLKPGRKARGQIAVTSTNQKITAPSISINRESAGEAALAAFMLLSAWERGLVIRAWREGKAGRRV